ncbi:UNVERIFIED_CONTAM: hypothetical protein RMT77_015192 [Armadillidium vulgare]
MWCFILVLFINFVVSKELSRVAQKVDQSDYFNSTFDNFSLAYQRNSTTSNNITNTSLPNQSYENNENNQSNFLYEIFLNNSQSEYNYSKSIFGFNLKSSSQFENISKIQNSTNSQPKTIILVEENNFVWRYNYSQPFSSENCSTCENLKKTFKKIHGRKFFITVLKSSQWHEHVTSHLKVMAKEFTTDKEVMSTDEVIFQTFLGHDLNSDLQFDVIEMTSLLLHLHHLFGVAEWYSDEELEALFDPLLKEFDIDQNGQFSYPEFRKMAY